MPFYEYRCKACNHVTTFLEMGGAAKEHACGKCQSKDTRKIFSTFAPQAGKPAESARPACASCPSGGSGSCPYSRGG